MRAGRAVAGLSAVFLDRDGVINAKASEGEYVTSWSDFRFLPNALDGLRELATLDVPIIVVTNQRGIALGRMDEAALADIHVRMTETVSRAGGRIDAIYHCPHAAGRCDCRKPAPGMFLAAARDVGVRLDRATMLGDRASDMEAAERAGVPLRLLVNPASEPMPAVAATVSDLREAARWLIGWSADRAATR